MLSKSPQSFSESSMINARSGDAMFLLQVIGQCCLIDFESKFETVVQVIRIPSIWRSYQLGRETIHRELDAGETPAVNRFPRRSFLDTGAGEFQMRTRNGA
jgi:hypothetical protein